MNECGRRPWQDPAADEECSPREDEGSEDRHHRTRVAWRKELGALEEELGVNGATVKRDVYLAREEEIARRFIKPGSVPNELLKARELLAVLQRAISELQTDFVYGPMPFHFADPAFDAKPLRTFVTTAHAYLSKTGPALFMADGTFPIVTAADIRAGRYSDLTQKRSCRRSPRSSEPERAATSRSA